MRWPHRLGGVRRPVPTVLAIFALWTLCLWMFLPYDHSVVLFFRFASQRAVSLLPQLLDPDSDSDWLFRSARFPVDLDRDVAFVTKTGYGTQFRVPAQLEALGLGLGTSAAHNSLVIADFATQLSIDGMEIQVHDVVARLVQSDAVADLGHSLKLQKYANMSAAIRSGSREQAISLSREVGWELDALKFIPGLELAHHKMPGKKWYVLLDDDTYILRPSLRLMLAQMDPARPVYLGNPVGDFKGRFAHGGSSIILSGAAMRLLFDDNAHLIPAAYVSSVAETWGDKLVATTFMKAGVYLDERYSRYFNGERPRITRISADRFCSPIVSFHGLADTRQMREVSDTFGSLHEPVVWGKLWGIYGQPDFDLLRVDSVLEGQDHVGRADESTARVDGVESAVECAELCDQLHSSCLAWTWNEGTGSCHTSPWMIIGEEQTRHSSGLNVALVMKLMSKCNR